MFVNDLCYKQLERARFRKDLVLHTAAITPLGLLPNIDVSLHLIRAGYGRDEEARGMGGESGVVVRIKCLVLGDGHRIKVGRRRRSNSGERLGSTKG